MIYKSSHLFYLDNESLRKVCSTIRPRRAHFLFGSSLDEFKIIEYKGSSLYIDDVEYSLTYGSDNKTRVEGITATKSTEGKTAVDTETYAYLNYDLGGTEKSVYEAPLVEELGTANILVTEVRHKATDKIVAVYAAIYEK